MFESQYAELEKAGHLASIALMRQQFQPTNQELRPRISNCRDRRCRCWLWSGDKFQCKDTKQQGKSESWAFYSR